MARGRFCSEFTAWRPVVSAMVIAAACVAGWSASVLSGPAADGQASDDGIAATTQPALAGSGSPSVSATQAKERSGDRIWTVPTVAALETMTFPEACTGERIWLLGYYEPGDGGGGETPLYVDKADTKAAGDRYSVFVCADGTRVKRPIGTTVKVREAGARGKGTSSATEDTAAIQRAMAYLIRADAHSADGEINRRTGVIEFGPGEFGVLNRVFDNLDFSESVLRERAPFVGFRFVGAHQESTVLTLKTNGAESWFYENPVGSAVFQRMHFENLQFRSDNPVYGNGFRQWSEGGPKQFHFYQCRFERIKHLMWCEGTGNADLTKFLLCTGQIYGNVLTLNNGQSVQHDFIGCDIGSFGDFINVKRNGGGNVNVSGGALDFIWYEGHSPEGGNWLFHADGDANIAQGNMTFCFRDCRIEMEAYQYKATGNPPLGLVKTSGHPNVAMPRVLFDNVTFVNGQTYTVNGNTSESPWLDSVTGTATKAITAVDIQERKYVHFRDCVLLKNFYYKISGSYESAGSPNAGGIIKIENCHDGILDQLPPGESARENIHKRVTITGNVGRFITSGILSHTTGGVFDRKILDYDQGARLAADREEASVKRVLYFKRADTGWPSAGQNEVSIDIPTGFQATRFCLRKPRTSGTAAYRLHLGSDDKSVVIASSAPGTFADEHVMDLSDIDFSAHSKLRIWSTGDPIFNFQSEGVGYIEY